jgi:hypothetical protein
VANYQAIMRLRPEVREFVRNRRWVHRGDVVTYGPNIRCDSFSTDGAGYRHSVFRGKTMSAHDCVQSERYGLVLGPSSVYGFGLVGNENTMPSQLAERFGFPFANIGLPEGNSRNLFAILNAFVARAPRPPAIVLHISGGDFTGFCYTSIADPVFGSPNVLQMQQALKERGGAPPAETQIKPLLAFTSLWIRSIGQLCRMRKIPLVLGNDTTFFEKPEPSAIERECELGKPFNPPQTRQFAIHNEYVDQYGDRRQAVADSLGVPLAGPGRPNSLGYVDEFHYDRDGTRMLCEDFADAIQTLL